MSAAPMSERNERWAKALADDGMKPKGEQRGIIPTLQAMADAELSAAEDKWLAGAVQESRYVCQLRAEQARLRAAVKRVRAVLDGPTPEYALEHEIRAALEGEAA